MIELAGTTEIAAPRTAVWDLLTDVERVSRCGPELESFERLDATHARVRTRVRLAFMTAGVTLDLELMEVVPLERAAVRARGEAGGNRLEAEGDLRLAGPPAGPTTVSWAATGRIEGPLAGFGSKMIEGAAQDLVDATFDCVRSILVRG